MTRPIAIIAALLFLSASCNTPSAEEVKKVQGETAPAVEGSGLVKPNGDAPEWGANITPEMLAVLQQLDSFKNKPIEELSATEARKNRTPGDAVAALMEKNNIAAPEQTCDVAALTIPLRTGKIEARIYTPKHGQAPFPVVVYYHGGGFVLGSAESYDASARAIAEKAGAVVVSVNYRLAPEHKFPAAHEDAYAAYVWATKNTGIFNGAPGTIAVAGESAGANLAANVSIMARERGAAVPIAQLLIYPLAGTDMSTDSYQKFANAQPLNRKMMQWFLKQYLNNEREQASPMIALVKANLEGLPPTLVITAGIDPLQSDGAMLAEKLKEAGVKVIYRDFPGVTHEFFGLSAVIPQATEAQIFAGSELKKVFAK